MLSMFSVVNLSLKISEKIFILDYKVEKTNAENTNAEKN